MQKILEKLKYTIYTVQAAVSLILILMMIIILTPIVLLLTYTIDKNKILYLFFTRLFIRFFFLLNFIDLKKLVDLNKLAPPQPGQRRIYVLNHASLVDGLLLFLL
ncbi:MAG: hypothetical protein MJB14_06505, partial [Spirochaetes bacterium]|nr:hypothetical protein [Spirochaetota bacterium]